MGILEIMRMDWRDRIQVLFSNQNPDMEPLPSWSEVPTRPSEHWAIEQWERDNVMRPYRAKRLNDGYIQTNIVIIESPYGYLEDSQYSSTDEYYSLDWFNEDYQMIEPTKIISLCFWAGGFRFWTVIFRRLIGKYCFNP